MASKSMSKKKIVILSALIILVCVCIIAGATFALFTESYTSTNHLYSGTLDIALTRTKLTYNTIDLQGYLKETTVTDRLDLTTTNFSEENVFGLDSQNVKIIPGSFFEAELEVKNVANVAFTYTIGMKMKGGSSELADQLKVTITHADNTTTVKTLKELASGITLDAGEMAVGDPVETFKIRVDFIEDTEYNGTTPPPASEMDNDIAQTKNVSFDLTVYAEQASK